MHDTKQYIYYAFYTGLDPVKLQSGNEITRLQEANGWIRVARIGKYWFAPSVQIPVAEDRLVPKVLLIGDPTEFPARIKTRSVIRDLKGDPVFDVVDVRANATVFYPSKSISAGSR